MKTKVVIIAGAGGVGKTSVASMIALDYALKNKKTLVITIDPAKRLFDALSIKVDTAKPVEVTFGNNNLFTFMPDLKKEWMDFLKASIGEKNKVHDISANHFYRYMARGFPGSLEIISCHILFRLLKENKYDVIVLDTPPSTNSLSFFDIPQKLSQIFEHNVFRMLMKGRHSLLFKFSKKLAFFGSGVLHKTLERLIGSHFLSEVIDFALSIDALYEPLYNRAKAMEKLLKDKATKWVLVLRPTNSSVDDSIPFVSTLKEKNIDIEQVIINQVFPKFSIDESFHGALEDVKIRLQNQLKFENSLIMRVRKAFKTSSICEIALSDYHGESQILLEQMLNDYRQGL